MEVPDPKEDHASSQTCEVESISASTVSKDLSGSATPGTRARDRRRSVFSMDGVSLHIPLPWPFRRSTRQDPAESPRRVFVNLQPDGDWADHKGRVKVRYAGNEIRSSKYTLVTFIPKNLYEQFRSFANAYFLFLILLQLFPQFQYTSPIVTAAPLTFIVTVVAIKNGIEDWERHKQDRELNERKTWRLARADWTNYNVRSGVRIGLRELNPIFWIESLLALLWKGIAMLFGLIFGGARKTKGDATLPGAETSGATVGRVKPKDSSLSASEFQPPSPSDAERSQAVGVPSSTSLPGLTRLPSSTLPPQIPEISVIGPQDDNVSFIEDIEDEIEANDDEEDRSRLVRGWTSAEWKQVVVGDLLLLFDGDPVPADSVIISSSEQDGMAFVETRNLDGETNLKVRRTPLMSLNHSVRDADSCQTLRLKVDAEAPSDSLHTFQGVIEELSEVVDRKEDKDHGDRPRLASTVAPLTHSNLLLRGSTLRNTHWCIALVIYTGTDAKIIRNAGATPSKRSIVEKKMNPQVLMNVLILLGMSLLCAVMHLLYTKSFNFSKVPWTRNDNPASTTVFIFFNCIIMFQNIIPLALYISADLGKTLQALFIHFDDFLAQPVSEPADPSRRAGDQSQLGQQTLVRASPRTWNLSDDLGQIEFIFSDKTGTLTQNVMEFRKCSVNGIIYGGGYLTEKPALSNDAGESLGLGPDEEAELDWERTKQLARRAMRRVLPANARRYVSNNPTFADERMWRDLSGDSGREQMKRLQMFWTHLAVCHTVLVEAKKETVVSGKTSEPRTRTVIGYKAQSPDEAALVDAARDSGFAFMGRKDTEVTVLVMGKERVFTVLNVLEFTSERKRMSVIAKADDGKIFLFCKGADSVVFDRLAPVFGTSVSALRQRAMEDLTVSHLDGFASEGLRTLCVAYRVVPPSEYSEWNGRYIAASTLLKNRDEEMARVAEEIELDLQLLGCTGIDDNLQDGVPEAIQQLRTAGIKIWVLTGDKLETAINIGFASNLLHQNSTLLIIKSCGSVATARRNLITALKSFWFASGAPSDQSFERALIIDGDSLQYALEPENRQLFLELACRCRAVMCCRASPLQKADVTKLVREGLGAACLAIGDGANDVNMIQQANIGVGITGKEGLQAAMSSDYTIAQFRFLARLLLVHGRWCYMRITDMIFVYFYKNVLWLFVLFWYQFYCGFSASDITDFVFGMFFSTLFTFLPNFVIGVFEQDINDRTAMAVPQLYDVGIRQALFTHEQFWLYVGDAIYQSCIYFFGAVLLFEDATPDPAGYTSDKSELGNMLAWMLIINGNLYILFVAKRWTPIIAWSLVITLTIFIVFVFVYWSLSESAAYGIIPRMLTMPAFWFQWLLCTVVAFMPRFVVDYVRQEFFPSDTALLREVEKFHIRSPVLGGADVWSDKDLDELYASWDKAGSRSSSVPADGGPTIPEPALSVNKGRSFTDDATFTGQTTGSESFDSLLRLRRVADSFSRSISGSFSALLSKVSPLKPPQPHPSMVYLDNPAESVPYGGYAFSAEPGAADLVVSRHSEHRSRTSSSDDGVLEPTHVRWLDHASQSSRKKSVAPTEQEGEPEHENEQDGGVAEEGISALGTTSELAPHD